MADQVKSGKEVLEDFFKDISNIKNVDKAIAEALSDLYIKGKLTDVNIKNGLQKLRDHDGNKD